MDLLHVHSKPWEGRPAADLAQKAHRSRRPAAAAHTGRTARQLRPAEVDELVVRYRELGSVAEVAREYGITRQTIGIRRAARGINHSPDERGGHRDRTYHELAELTLEGGQHRTDITERVAEH